MWENKDQNNSEYGHFLRCEHPQSSDTNYPVSFPLREQLFELTKILIKSFHDNCFKAFFPLNYHVLNAILFSRVIKENCLIFTIVT